MSVQIQENNSDANSTQHKVDTNLPQHKVDTKPLESKVEIQSEQTEDPNWRAFREARKQDKIMRDASDKMAQEEKARAEAFKAALEAVTKQPLQSNQYSNEYQEETEDQRIEKKVQIAIAKQKSDYEHQQREREKQEYPQRLQQTYSDFNQMISQDNLDYLEYHFPEVARPLQRGEDNFEKWSDIYKAVKRFVPNTNHKKDAQKAENNFNKPKSISSASVSPGGEAMPAHRIDEARKAANWERMQKQLKGLS